LQIHVYMFFFQPTHNKLPDTSNLQLFANSNLTKNQISKWKTRPLNNLCNFKSLESDSEGQNPLDSSVPYIIGNLLEHRSLKWVRMTHLDTSNTSYGQKKGWESIWQFDSRPLKVKNPCIQVAFNIPLESSQQGL
jgi:hypothetical protein